MSPDLLCATCLLCPPLGWGPSVSLQGPKPKSSLGGGWGVQGVVGQRAGGWGKTHLTQMEHHPRARLSQGSLQGDTSCKWLCLTTEHQQEGDPCSDLSVGGALLNGLICASSSSP